MLCGFLGVLQGFRGVRSSQGLEKAISSPTSSLSGVVVVFKVSVVCLVSAGSLNLTQAALAMLFTIWAVRQIRVPFGAVFTRVACCFGYLKRGANVENYPYRSAMSSEAYWVSLLNRL